MAVSAAMRRSLRLEPCRRCGVDRVAESQRLKTKEQLIYVPIYIYLFILTILFNRNARSTLPLLPLQQIRASDPRIFWTVHVY